MARVKIEIPTHAIFNTNITVRITDVNYGNHVGNDAIVRLLHEARMTWLTTGDYSELNLKGAALIMGDLAVVYKNESFYGDVLNIAISIGDITKVSFDIYYEITTQRNQKNIVIAQAKTGMVCFDYATKKVVTIPEGFKNYLGA